MAKLLNIPSRIILSVIFNLQIINMQDHLKLIDSFFKAFSERDFNTMKSLTKSSIVYYDPLYGYLNDEDVFLMWESRYSKNGFTLIYQDIKDEGDGYFTLKIDVTYFRKKMNRQQMKAYFKIENGFIAEYSHGFSVHQLCKQEYGLFGNLLGWNRLIQQRIKNDARRELLAYKSEMIN